MDSLSHGPGGDDCNAPTNHVTVSPRIDAPETIFRSRPLPANTTTPEVTPDEGKKEQVKPNQQKPALKKPDKLAPCPRCDSLDTKFCYYNNYNVNQPRHFCKNCQRYWTAGGTLRNVPVGAGRRKNKHSSLQARNGGVVGLPEQQKQQQQQQQHAGLVVRLDSQQRACHAQSQCVPEQTSHQISNQVSPPLASSSSDPSSQERGGSSNGVNHGSSIRNVEAVRRRYVPEPQASISSDPGGSSRMHDTDRGGSCDRDLAGETEKEDGAEACTSSDPGYSTDLDGTPTASEVQSTVRVPPAALQPVVAGMVRGVGLLDGSVWTAAPAPFGLYNGSWPFGYNVGWSGPPPGGPPICSPNGALVTCQPAVGGITTWPTPPSGMWPGVCWGSALIPGMPPGLVGSPWMSPPGWGSGWSMPWGAADAAAAASAAVSASREAAAAVRAPPAANSKGFPSKLPIRPVLSKHPRDRLELERVESSLWAPKMVRLDDPGNTPRSSVWTSVGAENRLESVAPGSNFKAFLPVRENGNDNMISNKASSVTLGNKKRVGSS